MAKRNSKADRILNDSAMRLEAAIMRERLAQSQLNTAKAVLQVAQEAHDALTSELTAQPRKKADKATTSPAAPEDQAKTVARGLCSHKFEGGEACNSGVDNAIHDPSFGYAHYHDFEPPKSVARARRKSKQKSEVTSSVPSSEIAKDVVTNAAHAASGGD